MKKSYVILPIILVLIFAVYSALTPVEKSATKSTDSLAIDKTPDIVSEKKPSKTEVAPENTTTPLMVIEEGVHYEVLATPLTIPAFKGNTISEFFWLGCPHCQNFEPLMVEWKKKLNAEMPTAVDKVAVPGSPRWVNDARVFFTMKTQGATEEQITLMFGLYKEESTLYQKLPSESRIKAFFEKVGLDADKSMSILKDENKLNAEIHFAKEEFYKLKATGVPVFIVNGKYKVLFDNIKSNDDVYEIMRALTHKKSAASL